MAPVRYGVVGAGWRAEFFARLAVAVPEEIDVVAVVARRPESAERLGRRGYPTVATVAELIEARPDFVVVCVPAAAAPGVITQLVHDGVPVLAETPPAPDLDGLQRLWAQVGGSGLVQVAEQYLAMPGHAARLELVRRGLLGSVSSVQVCSTHGYHAVSMIRGFLGAGFGPATVTARRFRAPLVQPLTRSGWSDDAAAEPAWTTIATLDFGPVSGVYDFTDNQWHNPLRARRLVIRGSHGEIVDDVLTRMTGPRTVVSSPLVRRRSGVDLDLTGFESEHISFEGSLLWANAFVGHRLSDEEIAIATMLTRTASWVRGRGPEPYPLAQACQDQLLSLAVEQAALTRRDVPTVRAPWAGAEVVP